MLSRFWKRKRQGEEDSDKSTGKSPDIEKKEDNVNSFSPVDNLIENKPVEQRRQDKPLEETKQTNPRHERENMVESTQEESNQSKPIASKKKNEQKDETAKDADLTHKSKTLSAEEDTKKTSQPLKASQSKPSTENSTDIPTAEVEKITETPSRQLLNQSKNAPTDESSVLIKSGSSTEEGTLVGSVSDESTVDSEIKQPPISKQRILTRHEEELIPDDGATLPPTFATEKEEIEGLSGKTETVKERLTDLQGEKGKLTPLEELPLRLGLRILKVKNEKGEEFLMFASSSRAAVEKNLEILKKLNLNLYPKPVTDISEGTLNGEKVFYYLTEYFEIKPLSEEKFKNLPLQEFFRIILTVIAALKELHSNKIVLAALRPEIISDGKPIKILDFSFALQEGQTVEEPLYFDGYSAPELMKPGETVDHRADIYSVGALFHLYFLKERVPYEGFSLFQKPIKFSGVPQILVRTLADDKNERFYSADVLHEKVLYLKREYLDFVPLDIAAKSIIGLNPGRTTNEDAYGYKFVEKWSYDAFGQTLIGAVADGMGGMQKGEIASKTAVESFLNFMEQNLESFQDKNELLKKAIEHANEEVLKTLGKEKGGTTIVGFLIKNGLLYLANVGDSRAYLVNERGIELLTTDHSYAWVLLVMDEKPRNEIIEEVRQMPERNSLIQSLGTKEEINPSLLENSIGKPHLNIHPGDTLIVCSDGVWDEVTEEELKEIVNTSRTSKEIVSKIIDKVLERGAPDNATVLVVRFDLITFNF